jgi:hypothetical protein
MPDGAASAVAGNLPPSAQEYSRPLSADLMPMNAHTPASSSSQAVGLPCGDQSRRRLTARASRPRLPSSSC